MLPPPGEPPGAPLQVSSIYYFYDDFSTSCNELERKWPVVYASFGFIYFLVAIS